MDTKDLYTQRDTHSSFLVILLCIVIIISIITIGLYASYKTNLQQFFANQSSHSTVRGDTTNTIIGVREKNIDRKLDALKQTIDQTKQRFSNTNDEAF